MQKNRRLTEAVGLLCRLFKHTKYSSRANSAVVTSAHLIGEMVDQHAGIAVFRSRRSAAARPVRLRRAHVLFLAKRHRADALLWRVLAGSAAGFD